MEKRNFKRITIDEFSTNLPDLKNIFESKSVVIAKWLIYTIKKGLKNGYIKESDILPLKSDFAYLLGVSVGTMQNSFRYVEDLGLVESKQCIGTIVKNNNKPSFKKLTTKRDLATEAIKRYISSSAFSVGAKLPSSRTIATIIGHSANTTRIALEYLSIQNIIEHRYKNAKEYGWVVKSLDFELNNYTQKQTLANSITEDLEKFIETNLKIGDKMPSHHELAKKLNTSIKTVHDGLKVLVSKGILLARRGRYGTTVIKIPNDKNINLKPETSIFAPAKDCAFYHYEKIENHIKRMIANEYQVGDKLPSINELSLEFDISPNTIRKAIHNLAKDGYLLFSRGRYGGTFVIDIPEIEQQTFKWLAVNPQYAQMYKATYK